MGIVQDGFFNLLNSLLVRQKLRPCEQDMFRNLWAWSWFPFHINKHTLNEAHTGPRTKKKLREAAASKNFLTKILRKPWPKDNCWIYLKSQLEKVDRKKVRENLEVQQLCSVIGRGNLFSKLNFRYAKQFSGWKFLSFSHPLFPSDSLHPQTIIRHWRRNPPSVTFNTPDTVNNWILKTIDVLG